MTAAEVLRAAREIIASPGAWCRGALARDGDGLDLDDADSERAISWCALGALVVAAPTELFDAALELVTETLPAVGWLGERLESFNDGPATEHRHVLALFEAAIRRAEAADHG